MSESRDGQRYYDTSKTATNNTDDLLKNALFVIKNHEQTINRMRAFLEHTYEGDGNIDFDELHLALYGKQR